MHIIKKNIFLKNTKTIEKYSPYTLNLSGVKDPYPLRDDHKKHADLIRDKFQECITKNQNFIKQGKTTEGLYLEFASKSEYKLAFISLEDQRSHIHLLNTRIEENIEKATIFIPKGKESKFLRKIEDYKTKTTKSGLPSHNDLIRSIENISNVILESFWTSDKKTKPKDIPEWCELWLLFDINLTKNIDIIAEKTTDNCNKLGIEISKNYIEFPERIVFQIKANWKGLRKLLQNCEYISEIRKANIPTNFFLNSPNIENNQWMQNLLKNTDFHDTNTFICLLDTGLNYEHPLIKPTIKSEKSIQAINEAWGNSDINGHGTKMAGIAIYCTLNEKIHDKFKIDINHKIESIKILPNIGQNQPEFYGDITMQAVYKAEIENPEGRRIFCMAVTAPQSNNDKGTPSSWSSTIDKLTSNSNEDNENKLFIISAGNINTDEFDIHDKYNNTKFNILDPGQSWNALTVGAITDKDFIEDAEILKQNYRPISKKGDLSPFSRSSTNWDKIWPIKPEILFDGGNMMTNEYDVLNCDDLSLLTTSNNISEDIFSHINATSAASAQASNMAAQIYSAYPNIWPETVRALMIHSASWTQKMIDKYAENNLSLKSNIKNLLKHCGYGRPNLQKAIQCAENKVNLIIQEDFSPFYKFCDGSIRSNMHYHNLPWPKSEIRKLEGKNLKIKITLSYFIEPGPGEIGWNSKYKYPSCGLRFAFKNTNETNEEFKERINKLSKGKDFKNKNDNKQNWLIGSQNRNSGSIHSDTLESSAIDFVDMDLIAIFPVTGWWKTRTNLKKYNKSIRYSLIVSLETPETKTNLYTAIINQIPSGKAIISNTINTPDKKSIYFEQDELF